MPINKAKKEANARWDKKNMLTIGCRLRREEAEEFKKYCDTLGKNSNTVLKEYVLECINDNNKTQKE